MPTTLETKLGQVEGAADAAGKIEDLNQARELWQQFSDRMRYGKAMRMVPGFGLALAGIEGAAHSARSAFNGEREQWERNMGGAPDSRLGQLGFDVARTFGDVGNAVLMGQAQRISDGITATRNGMQDLEYKMQNYWASMNPAK